MVYAVFKDLASFQEARPRFNTELLMLLWKMSCVIWSGTKWVSSRGDFEKVTINNKGEIQFLR